MYSFHSLSNSEPKLNVPREHRTPSVGESDISGPIKDYDLVKEYMNEVTQDICLIYIT